MTAVCSCLCVSTVNVTRPSNRLVSIITPHCRSSTLHYGWPHTVTTNSIINRRNINKLRVESIERYERATAGSTGRPTVDTTAWRMASLHGWWVDTDQLITTAIIPESDYTPNLAVTTYVALRDDEVANCAAKCKMSPPHFAERV